MIAGSVTESAADLETVVRWLGEQFEPLRHAEISVIAWARDQAQQHALSRICDVVLADDQRLDVHADENSPSARLAFHVRGVEADAAAAALSLSVGRLAAPLPRLAGSLHYHILPASRHLHANRLTSGNGVLTGSAGPTQAASPDEQQACGCLLIDADTAAGSLTAKFVETDVLRFGRQNIVLDSDATPTALRDRIARAVRDVDTDNGRTQLVDWVISGEARVDGLEAVELSEQSLLQFVRSDLQAGHRGVWPRSVRYAVSTMAAGVSSLPSIAMQEFVNVLQADHGMQNDWREETLAGLELLARAG